MRLDSGGGGRRPLALLLLGFAISASGASAQGAEAGGQAPYTEAEAALGAREALNKTGVVSWYETTGEL